jgi:dihydroorotase
MTGLESALSVVYETMVVTGLMNWAAVADRMSVQPALIGRVSDQGQPIAAGSPANLVIFDPRASELVEARKTVSASRNTPYAGRTLPGKVVATFYRGKPTVRNGELSA